MEVLYYAIGIVGSWKILKDLSKPVKKIEVMEEDYFGDDELPKTDFYYDKDMYMANDKYAKMIDEEIFNSQYGQYIDIDKND